ncbi:MAG: PEP-CTERM sorting domain-containing protein [Planctomycetota bacterium]
MKTTILAAAVAAVAVPSLASAQDFSFIVDPATGGVTLESSVPFAGFTFTSDSDALLPDNLPFAGGNPGSGLILLDPNTFTVLSVLSSLPSDISGGTTGAAVGAGVYDLGSIVDIAALSDGPDAGLALTYLTDTNEVQPGVVVIPEPATAGLMGIASLGLLRRRRA